MAKTPQAGAGPGVDIWAGIWVSIQASPVSPQHPAAHNISSGPAQGRLLKVIYVHGVFYLVYQHQGYIQNIHIILYAILKESEAQNTFSEINLFCDDFLIIYWIFYTNCFRNTMK